MWDRREREQHDASARAHARAQQLSGKVATKLVSILDAACAVHALYTCSSNSLAHAVDLASRTASKSELFSSLCYSTKCEKESDCCSPLF